MTDSIKNPKTQADFLQHSHNLINTAGTLEKNMKLGEELKTLIDRQYLLNEALSIGDNAEGYNKIKIELAGISHGFCGGSKFNLLSDSILAKQVLELISKATRDRIVEIKTILKID